MNKLDLLCLSISLPLYKTCTVTRISGGKVASHIPIGGMATRGDEVVDRAGAARGIALRSRGRWRAT
jgi:hypothetical protein